MGGYRKVLIILKDSSNHDEYNRRIMEYLTDRHTIINDNKYTIAIEVADDDNINQFVKQGVESVPAMQIVDGDYIYGVNSILSGLAKLEMSQPKSLGGAIALEESTETSAFYDMVIEEMQNGEQEDPDAPSTLKAYHQDTPEMPLSDKAFEEKAKAYNRIYEQRMVRNSPNTTHSQIKKPTASQNNNSKNGMDVNRFINKGNFDKGEEMLMRQIASNLA